MNRLILPLHPNVNFAELRLGPSSQSLITRVLRYWEVEHPSNVPGSTALTILMIDNKGSLTHAFVPHNLWDAYFGALREGAIYEISHFEVHSSTKLYKLTSSPFVIKFTHTTNCKQVWSSSLTIPRESFDIHSYDQIMGVANTGLALPDIIGKICIVEGPNLFDPTCTEMITLTVALQPDVMTTLNLWGNIAAAFHNLIIPPAYAKPVILVTSVNPNIIGGRLTFDSTNATRFFFSASYSGIQKHFQSFGPEELLTYEINDTSTVVRKIENVSIREIVSYTRQAGHTNADFLSESLVMDAKYTSAANHSTSASCTPNMTGHGNSQLCWDCEVHNYLRDDRLHVALKVFDGSAMATFLMTETELNEFWSATENNITMVTNQQEHSAGNNSISQKIKAMVGQICLFKIRINP